MVSKFGNKVVIAAVKSRDEIEAHLSRFTRNLHIVQYILRGIEHDAPGNTKVQEAVAEAQKVIDECLTKEADEYLDFYGVTR